MCCDLLKETFEKLHQVPAITIGGWCLEILSLVEMEGVPSPLSKCQNLTLRGPVSQWDLPGIVYMLRSSPCLEKLVIHLTDLPPLMFKLDEEHFNFDEEDFLCSRKGNFQCLPKHLKRVEIIGLEADSFGSKHLLALIKFLLGLSLVENASYRGDDRANASSSDVDQDSITANLVVTEGKSVYDFCWAYVLWMKLQLHFQLDESCLLIPTSTRLSRSAGHHPVTRGKAPASRKLPGRRRARAAPHRSGRGLPWTIWAWAALAAVERGPPLPIWSRVPWSPSPATLEIEMLLGLWLRDSLASIMRRVAQELGVKLGEEVGYAIRFEDRTLERTRIKYLTDGALLRESLSNPELGEYSVIILDEAHERSLNTDILLGLMKRLIKIRSSNLRVLITSATLDGNKVSKFFSDCPVLNVPGKLYPVEIVHSRERPTSYLESSLRTALNIHLREPEGDVLIFMTGQVKLNFA
ncbi:hypothetical protein NL676_029629 [Syzygium grande]|nr:hypothetical protein NL676_029629 [Syzygium grande]